MKPFQGGFVDDVWFVNSVRTFYRKGGESLLRVFVHVPGCVVALRCQIHKLESHL